MCYVHHTQEAPQVFFSLCLTHIHPHTHTTKHSGSFSFSQSLSLSLSLRLSVTHTLAHRVSQSSGSGDQTPLTSPWLTAPESVPHPHPHPGSLTLHAAHSLLLRDSLRWREVAVRRGSQGQRGLLRALACQVCAPASEPHDQVWGPAQAGRERLRSQPQPFSESHSSRGWDSASQRRGLKAPVHLFCPSVSAACCPEPQGLADRKEGVRTAPSP